MKLSQVLAVATITLTSVSGCGGTSGTAVRTGQAVVSGSRSVHFGSLEQLAENSTAVIVATIGVKMGVDEVGDVRAPIPFTRYKLQDVKVLAGDLSGVESLRQLGAPGDRPEDAAELESGRRYLLYVQPFYFSDRKPTGQVQVTGYAGAFRATAGSSHYAKVDGGSPDLPAQVEEATAKAAAARLGTDPSLRDSPTQGSKSAGP